MVSVSALSALSADMGSGDAGGVLVSPAPTSIGGLTTAVGRLLEPELIAFSSHGGHHLFINRIPPRLPKEDVEKIILAQLRLHPFLLQVSKCSVIPQNSLKNKGYGFITLDGSPSPSDLDTIASSLNNKLQVGCRTLGVRVCTDCHSACYGDDDGCASSSSRCSTPPNEPSTFDVPDAQGPQTAADEQLSVDCLGPTAAAAPSECDALGPAPDQAITSPSSVKNVVTLQQEILQTAVAVLAKQRLAAMPSTVAIADQQRRRKPMKPGQDRRLQVEHSRHQTYQHYHQLYSSQAQQQLYQGPGLQEGPKWLEGKGLHTGPHGLTHAAIRPRQTKVDVTPSVAASEEVALQALNAQTQALERGTDNGGQGSVKPPAAVVLLQPTALTGEQPQQSQQQPLAAATMVASQQIESCGLNVAPVSGSPRSVSNYSSAPGSAPNSAPESVTGSGSAEASRSGSDRASGSSFGGWCGREDIANVRMVPPSGVAPAPPPLGSTLLPTATAPSASTPVGLCNTAADAQVSIAPIAAFATFATSPPSNGASSRLPTSQQRQPSQQQQQLRMPHLWEGPQQQMPVATLRGRDPADSGPSSKPPPPSREQQHPIPGPALSNQQQQQQQGALQQPAVQTPSQFPGPRLSHTQARQAQVRSSGSLTRRSRSPIHVPRAAPASTAAAVASAVLVPHGRGVGRGQFAVAQSVPAQAPTAAVAPPLQQPQAWPASHALGYGPTGQAHLQSASAPTSSSWHLQQYNQQHQNRQGYMHHRPQQQQQVQQAQRLLTRPYGLSNSGNGVDGDGHCVDGARTSSSGRGAGAGPLGAFGANATRLQKSLKQGPDQAMVQGPCHGHPHGIPRPAWLDGTQSVAADDSEHGFDVRGSYPGAPKLATVSLLPVAQKDYPQPPPLQQHQLQLHQQPSPLPQPSLLQSPQPLSQQPRPALHLVNYSPASGTQSQQLQQPVANAAYEFVQDPQQQHHHQQIDLHFPSPSPPQQQQPAGGPCFSQQQVPPLQEMSSTLPLMQQQAQQPLLQQRSFLQLPLPSQPPQPMSSRQQSQPQMSSFAQGLEGGTLARAHSQPAPPTQLSSQSCQPSVPSKLAEPLLSLQMTSLEESYLGFGSHGFHLRGTAQQPLMASAPSGFAGWRGCSFDLDFDMQRGPKGGVTELQLPAAAQVGSLGAAATSVAAALSVRSTELLLGRGSSDGFQDPDQGGSADSADLDPLDLEPMILQLLENEDDDGGGSGGSGSGRSSGMPAVAAAQLDSRETKADVGCQDANAHQGQQQQQQWHHYQQQHRLSSTQQRQRQPGGLAVRKGSKLLPSATPSSLQPPAAPAPTSGFGGNAAGLARPIQQPTRMCPPPPQQQQPGVAVAWGLPESRSDGSRNLTIAAAADPAAASSSSAVLGLAFTPSPAQPALPASNPTNAQGGMLPSPATTAAPAQAPVIGAPRERVGAGSAPAGVPWVPGRGDADAAPRPEPGPAGSFQGGGNGGSSGAFGAGRAGAGAHRLGGVPHRFGTGGGSRTAGAGAGGGGRGMGPRGPRSHGGGGRVPNRNVVYVGHGGRVLGPRTVTTGTSSGVGFTGGGSINLRVAPSGGGGSHNTGGGAGGFETPGFVSSSLPNANLLAVMQRLDT